MPRHNGSKRRVSRELSGVQKCTPEPAPVDAPWTPDIAEVPDRTRMAPSKYARRPSGRRRSAPSPSLLDRLADVVPTEPSKDTDR